MAIPSTYNGLSGSDAAIAFMNARYGAVKYNQQSVKRYPYYYRYPYPTAGSVTIPFFGTSRAQSTEQITNIEQAGNFGNVSYLIESFAFDWYMATPDQPDTYALDADTIYPDIVHGFAQAGWFQFQVGNQQWLEMPLPFQSCPPANGRPHVGISQGAFSFTQAGGSPFGVTGTQVALCYADLERRSLRKMKLQQNIFLAPQQNFLAQINYDLGAVPVIGTTAVPNGTTLYLECRIDGWLFEGLT